MGHIRMSADAKKANRLFLGFKDMADVLRYLRAFEDLKEIEEEKGCSEYGDHREAILLAAIVAYGRSFKKSRSDGKADHCIDPAGIGLFAGEPSLEALHEVVINLRDKAAAHADWEFHQTELVEATETSALRKSPRPFYGQGLAIPEFIRLAEFVLQKCRNMTFDLDRAGVSSAAP